MGNVINRHQIVIDFDVWEPFKKDADNDMSELVSKIRSKELLKNCGNVHLHFEDKGKV